MAQPELREEIQEVWALFKDTDRRMKETDERMRETDEWIKETGRIVRETSEQVKETSRKVEQLNETVNALTGKWGKFVEGLVAPGAVRMFKERGIELERTSTRNKIQKNGTEMEIDVIVENEDYVVAIEVKSTLTVEDVNEHLEKLSRFREFFLRFKEQKLIGAVAGIVIEEGSDKYADPSQAQDRGLFVIGQTGETVKILNDDKFRPKIW